MSTRRLAYWSADGSKKGTSRAKGANTFAEHKDRGHRYLVPRMPVPEIEDVIEDLMVGAHEGPLNFDFNIACYSQDGMGTVTAQDKLSPNGAKKHAFDRDPKSVWVAKNSTSWIQYQCPDGKKYVVGKYRITSGYDAVENDPGSWTLSGSNDKGETWTKLDARTNESFNGRGKTREFAFENSTAYNLYRLQFSASGNVQVAGIELLERISNEVGIPVVGVHVDRKALTVPVAGRAALHVTVLPRNALNKNVAWISSDPTVAAVKRIGKNTAIVSGRGAGACRVEAVTADGKKMAVCQVAVTPSTLPAPWVYQEVNSPAVPGCAVYDENAFRVTSGGMAIEKWWLRVWDQFGFVNRESRDDGAIAARITAQTESHRYAVAGLMFRESTAKDSRFVMLGVQPTREILLRWRDDSNDESPPLNLGKVELPMYLKLERRGTTFHAYLSQDGVNWGDARGSHTGKSYERTMKVGLCVTAHNNPTTSTAVFDHVSWKESHSAK